MMFGEFEVELWHVALMFGSVMFTVFKNEIGNFFTSYVSMRKMKGLQGKTVELVSPTGEWEQVMVHAIVKPIPFFRNASVEVLHQNGCREKFNFDLWRSTRYRIG